MQILLASSNPHKVAEIQAVWEELRRGKPDAPAIDLIGLDTLGKRIREPVEDQPTFEANAILKATYYARKTKLPCLADDSGLEVDALNGEPGVRSARYAGVTGPRTIVDPANNQRLMQNLSDLPAEKRTARFVCAMALHASEISKLKSQIPNPLVARGTIEGRILTPAEANRRPDGSFPGRGTNGFGYDPLFFVPSLGQTTAELTPAEKNRISHRGRAARKMWEQLTRSMKRLTDTLEPPPSP